MPIVTHRLKTDPRAFYAVRDDLKPFEARFNDRFYQSGDHVELIYWNPQAPNGQEGIDPDTRLTPDAIIKRIGWMMNGGLYGLEPGHVVFALEPVDGAVSAATADARLTEALHILERMRGYADAVCSQITSATNTLNSNQKGALRYLALAVRDTAPMFPAIAPLGTGDGS